MVDNYLLKVTNTYRVATVDDALALREEIENNIKCGELINFSYTQKYIKVKGEIVEEYQLVKATIEFTPEKEPDEQVRASYNVEF